MLSDSEIVQALLRREIVIDPPPLDAALQPCSVELHLSRDLMFPRPSVGDWQRHEAPEMMAPRQFVLASTLERISVPAHLSCEVFGKSSLGREGIAIHITAGLVDPGFSGTLTLELYNHSPWPFELREGMAICQIVFYRLSASASRPYGHAALRSRYQGQQGATASKRSK